MEKNITVLDILSEQGSVLKLQKVVYTPEALEYKIRTPDINRPGLAFVDFYDYFDYNRVQIIGQTELTYLEKLEDNIKEERIKKFMNHKFPCVIFSRNMEIPEIFIKEAKNNNTVILSSTLTTTRIIGSLTLFLEDCFALSKNIHGTLMDVHGVGVLLLGGSGVGKSECAIDLIERGHRLVADDLVKIVCKIGKFLMGSGVSFIRHHMEIRGLGIVDIRNIYGTTAVRNQKRIGLVISLEEWDSNKEYERLGLEEKVYEILEVKLPHFLIPVKPGRNISVLIEVAAATQRLKRMGINPVKEIEKKMFEVMSKGANPLDYSF